MMHGLPIDLMLRDAGRAWKLFQNYPNIDGLLGDMACHVWALVDTLEQHGQWISVDHAMPIASPIVAGDRPRSDKVLILINGDSDGPCHIARFFAPYSRTVWSDLHGWHEREQPGLWIVEGRPVCGVDGVRYWQPLPAPPGMPMRKED